MTDLSTDEQHVCDYPYPHTAAACANYARVEASVNKIHPYADDETGTVSYPPGSGDAAIRFLSRHLP